MLHPEVAATIYPVKHIVCISSSTCLYFRFLSISQTRNWNLWFLSVLDKWAQWNNAVILRDISLCLLCFRAAGKTAFMHSFLAWLTNREEVSTCFPSLQRAGCLLH